MPKTSHPLPQYPSMADNYAISCLLGAMDHLWFHHVIRFSDSSTAEVVSGEISFSSTNDSSIPLISEEEDSSITSPQDESDKQESEKETTYTSSKETLTRLNLLASKARSQSSSPSTPKRSKYSYLERKLQKTMSCKSLCELELEEVKGFMDLGFIFNKEHLSKRMMSVIPGLQRLELSKNSKEQNQINISTDDETEAAEEGLVNQCIIRPYLSEAWLIKRPDSPLLNLRIPTVSTAANMKNHLKYWARTVASAIQLES